MMRRARAAIPLAAAAWLAACQPGADDAPPGESATGAPTHHFTVDSAGYTLRRDGDALATSIGFVFRNRLADTVSVVNCNGHVVMNLEKRVGEGWEPVWHGMTNACLSPPLVIAPGDSLAGRIEVSGADPGHPSLPVFETAELDGEFRLAWYQPRLRYDAERGNLGDTLALADRVTTPFRLRRPGD